MGKIKDIMIEAEAQLYELLNGEGATNQQALDVIQRELGTLAKEHAEEILRQWREET
tara:strand:+ start:583 stop:753 length:171 start_codon:yes stop_codon:yes gene_type:complete